MDAQPASDWIPCNNCILNVKTLETLEYDARNVLQYFFGLSLTWNRSFQVFAILYGEGGNGKGVVMEVLKELNEGAYSSVGLASFGSRFDKWHLTQNRVNLYSSSFQFPVLRDALRAVVRSSDGGQNGKFQREVL